MPNEKMFLRVLLLFVLSSMCFTPISAQSSSATLNGSVVDQQGASIPGVTVTITNPATGFERIITTDDSGSFNSPLLQPGSYTLLVEAQGFRRSQVSNVILNVGDQKALKVQLSVGDVKGDVVVTAEAPLISTSPAVGTTIDRTFVENMPLNGRTLQSLMTLTPGVVVGAGDGQISVNGQRTNANYLTVDGVSANIGVTRGAGAVPLVSPGLGVPAGFEQNTTGATPGYSILGTTNNLFSIEETQEFQVQTSNANAAFGRQSGGQISLTTRSGSNDFHGTLYEYWRHEKFDARDWFANASPTFIPKQRLRQHNFGFFLSGPVVLPRFGEGVPVLWTGKNKTFFYVNYEGLRLTLPQAAVVRLVPSTQFRSLANLHPAVRSLLNAYPLPTDETAAGCPTRRAATATGTLSSPFVPVGTLIGTCFVDANSSRTTMNAFRVKVDHNFNSNNTISARFNYAPMRAETFQAAGRTLQEGVTTTFTANYRTVISANITNEVSFNWSKNTGLTTQDLQIIGGAVPVSANLLLPTTAPERSSAQALLQFSSFSSLPMGPSNDNLQKQWNVIDNFRWTAGTHNLGFGIDYRRMNPTVASRDYQVNYSFLTLAAVANPSPTVSSLTIFSRDAIEMKYDNFSAYAQDTWQARKDLTLDFGVRWEVNTPPKGVNVPLYTLKGFPDLNNLVLSTDPFFKTRYNSFAPRLGMVYQLGKRSGWETVLRGGYGLYYDLGQGSLASGVMQFPYFRRLPTPLTNVAFPTPDASLVPPAAANLAPPYTGQGFTLVAPDYVLPRVHQWSFSVAQSIGGKNLVSASYVASAGRHLLRRYFLGFAPATPPPGNTLPTNPNLPNGSLNITRNDGDFGDESDYKSLQIQFGRRLSKGWQALVNYTLSKAEDTGSSDSTGANQAVNIATSNSVFAREYKGYSDFDRRHVFNAAITYELPTWKFENSSLNILSKIFIKGWATDFNFKYQSEAPLTVTYGYIDPISFISYTYRANVVAGQDIWLIDPSASAGRRLNPAAFAVPSASLTTNPGQVVQGNQVRNGVRGFGLHQLDFSLRRTFAITEKVKLQFRAEFFNATNHPNFAPPTTNLGTVSGTTGAFTPISSFGRTFSLLSRASSLSNTNGGLSSAYAIGGPRSSQFSVKLLF